MTTVSSSSSSSSSSSKSFSNYSGRKIILKQKNNGSSKAVDMIIPPILFGILIIFVTWFTQQVQKTLDPKVVPAVQEGKDEGVVSTDVNFRHHQNVTIIDDFLRTGSNAKEEEFNDDRNQDNENDKKKEIEIFRTLQDKDLWKSCSNSNGGWIDKSTPPIHGRNTTIWEVLSLRIWKSVQPEIYELAEGFEWWCNILDSTTPLNWHVDKDEKEFQLNRKIVQPIMGAVYYGFNHTFEDGGFLQLIDADAYEDPIPHIEQGKIVRKISADFNRVITFNASLWHSVSDIIGRGQRYTLAVNAWKKRPLGIA